MTQNVNVFAESDRVQTLQEDLDKEILDQQNDPQFDAYENQRYGNPQQQMSIQEIADDGGPSKESSFKVNRSMDQKIRGQASIDDRIGLSET